MEKEFDYYENKYLCLTCGDQFIGKVPLKEKLPSTHCERCNGIAVVVETYSDGKEDIKTNLNGK